MKTPLSFNFIQRVFTLNMLSNLASDRHGSPSQLQSELSTMLDAIFKNADIQKLIGNWHVIWGPVVGSYGDDTKTHVVSNAMYLAKNDDGQYVIAVSATNPESLYGWFTEDFDVRTMVAWNGSVEAPADAPRISQGTSDGLNHLLSLLDAKGISLMEKLNKEFSATTQKTQLVVSGHSLGGALSPTLALYIDEAQNTWNPTNAVIVSTMPTAGASPGNRAFSDYQNKLMGARTLRFWNKLDPVPHGWQPDMVEQVPFLYYPYLKPDFLLKSIAALVLAQSLEGTAPYPEGGFYTALQPQVSPLPGQVAISSTIAPSAAEVLQAFIDMGAHEILIKLGVNSFISKLIVDALNLFLQDYANEVTIDALLDKLEAYLQKIPGHDTFLKKFLQLLEILLPQIENLMLFLLQLVFQHVTTYAPLMGTSAVHPLSQAIVNDLVRSGGLDPAYTDVMDKITDPKHVLKVASPKIGTIILGLLTDDFVQKNGLGVMKS